MASIYARDLSDDAIKVRRGELADVRAVLDLWAQARSGHASRVDRAEDVERLIEDSPAALLVAERDDEIVGVLIAAWDGWRGNMYRLAVRDARRRGGVGLALVRAGEERLRERGARRVTALVAFEDEQAGAFWDAAGYPRIGRSADGSGTSRRGTMRTMKQRVSLVTLGVADLRRSRGFYEALGWTTNAGPEDDVVFFQAGDMVVALWDRARLAEDSCVEDSPGWGGITLAVNVGSPAEVDAIVEEARAAGARIGREPAETFWGGYSSVILDPDGHPWEIAHNPHWAVTEDGGVRLSSEP